MYQLTTNKHNIENSKFEEAQSKDSIFTSTTESALNLPQNMFFDIDRSWGQCFVCLGVLCLYAANEPFGIAKFCFANIR